jgi:tRNA-Thr(GGU) m(6)t(6)A37 methyltransferase TsaA
MGIQMEPIGRVANGIAYGTHDVRWESIISTVVLSPEWTEGLDGIEEFSHIIVIFYLDRARDERPLSLKRRPEGRAELPEVGLFCTRTPIRPNNIGVTTVRLLRHEGNALTVEGLDAYDGTPVLDIKPYLRRGDLVVEATAADWVQRLWRMQDEMP